MLGGSDDDPSLVFAHIVEDDGEITIHIITGKYVATSAIKLIAFPVKCCECVALNGSVNWKGNPELL